MNSFGVDGCKAGWLYITIDEYSEDYYKFGVLSEFSEINEVTESFDSIVVDIPIGLKSSGPEERICDLEARRLLKPPRSSSVFPAPCRLALDAETYEEASSTNKKYTGRKLSKQSWALFEKIRQVDKFVRDGGKNIHEMHPEVCFWALNGERPLSHSKKRKEGFEERVDLLRNHLDDVDQVISKILSTFPRKIVAKDDIADALVGVVAAEKGFSYVVDTFEKDKEGIQMQMVYPRLPTEEEVAKQSYASLFGSASKGDRKALLQLLVKAEKYEKAGEFVNAMNTYRDSATAFRRNGGILLDQLNKESSKRRGLELEVWILTQWIKRKHLEKSTILKIKMEARNKPSLVRTILYQLMKDEKHERLFDCLDEFFSNFSQRTLSVVLEVLMEEYFGIRHSGDRRLFGNRSRLCDLLADEIAKVVIEE